MSSISGRARITTIPPESSGEIPVSTESLAIEAMKVRAQFADEYRDVVSNKVISPVVRVSKLLSFIVKKKASVISELGGGFILQGLTECGLTNFSQGGYQVNKENMLVSTKPTNTDDFQYLYSLLTGCAVDVYELIFYNDFHRCKTIMFYKNDSSDTSMIKLIYFFEIFGLVVITDNNDIVSLQVTDLGESLFAEIKRRHFLSTQESDTTNASFWRKSWNEYGEGLRKSMVYVMVGITILFIIYVCWGIIFPFLKQLIPEPIKGWIRNTQVNIEDDKKFIVPPPGN